MISETLRSQGCILAYIFVWVCVFACTCVSVSGFGGLIPQSCNGMRSICSILRVHHIHSSINGFLCFTIKAWERLCACCCYHMVIATFATIAFSTKAVFIATMLLSDFVFYTQTQTLLSSRQSGEGLSYLYFISGGLSLDLPQQHACFANSPLLLFLLFSFLYFC